MNAAVREFKITLRSESQQEAVFYCRHKLSVLRAAKNTGIELSAGCMQGRCYTCRATLITGSVTNSRGRSPYATVDPADLGNAQILLCSVTPTSDIIVTPDGPWLSRKNKAQPMCGS